MKRKYLAIIYLLLLSIGTILSLYIPKNEVTANDAVVIPSDAIRLRILANSDSAEDQALKRLVRDEVNEEITKWVSELTSKEEAREVIKEGLPEIKEIAEKVVAEQNSDQDVNVEFGLVEFPTKLYGEFLYPAGKYEAILITLGNGAGANWWCVLFPPLCFLDFSNGVAVSQGFDEEEKEEKNKKAEAKEDEQSKETNTEEDAEPAAAIAAVSQIEEKAETKESSEEQAEMEEDAETADTAAAADDESASPAKEQEREVKEEKEQQAESEPKQELIIVEEDEVEVKFFIKEVWDRIFG